MEVSSSSMMLPKTPLAAMPGKSAQAVGQLAKVAVAEAKAASADLPRNAQGMAASAIARGADPGSVFAALIAPETDPVAEDVSTGDTPDVAGDVEVVVGEVDVAIDVSSAAEDAYAAAAAATGVKDDAEIALELLNSVV